MGIRSFIYADYDLGKEDWKEDELKLYDYHLLAVREFSPDEIILPEKYLWLPPEMKFGKKHRFILEQMKDYGFWAVFERNEDKDSQHGPKRISLLFLSREGVVTYSSLYLRNKISPTIVALIRPNAGNWECFRGYNSPLETVAEHGISMPAYYLGDGISPCEWRGYSLVDNNFYRYSKQ